VSITHTASTDQCSCVRSDECLCVVYSESVVGVNEAVARGCGRRCAISAHLRPAD